MMPTIRLIPAFVAFALLAALPLYGGQAVAKTSSFMTECSAKWKTAKANGTVPAGMKWPDFMKTMCDHSATDQGTTTDSTATDSSATDSSASYVPPEPQQTTTSTPAKPTQNWRSIAVAKADKNGKAFSQGQIEAHQRIKECAAEWHEAKANNSLATGSKWPRFWSDCNKRLKVQN